MSGSSPQTHPCREDLIAFSRGDLTEIEAAAIEDHLPLCQACREVVDEGPGDDPFLAMLRQAAAMTTPDPASESTRAAGVPRLYPTGYDVIETLGRGGIGIVFRARQRSLGRVVALKQLRAGLDADETELARFRSEAEAMARLHHPHLVQVFDVGQQDGLPYLAMELMEGGSLAQRLAAGPLRPVEAARLVETIARGIHHAHEAGIVHRDLTPSNILFTRDGTPKVADFGLAKRVEGEGMRTRTGVLLGTPNYMAPEQTEGRPAGACSDIYALGAILYECLTGRPPFQAATPLETIHQVQTLDPPPPSRIQPGMPRDLQTIALCCLEKDPVRRYSSAAALADDLGRFLRHEPILARPSGLIVRLRKWARRRPYRAGLVVMLGLAMVGAFVGLAIHNARLQVEIDRANRATQEARRKTALAVANYREARDAIQKILSWTTDPKFANFPRRTELHRAQVEGALPFYENVMAAADLADPEVLRDTALAAIEAANLRIVLGQTKPAEQYLLRAMALLDDLAVADPADRVVENARIVSRVKLGVMESGTNPARSLELFQEARSLVTRQERRDPDAFETRRNVAWCEYWLGMACFLIPRHDEAVPHFERSVEVYRSLLGADPEVADRADHLASSLVQLAEIDRLAGRFDQAEPRLNEAAALYERALQTAPDSPSVLCNLAQLQLARGNIAAARGEAQQALEQFDRGVEVVEAVLRNEPDRADARRSGVALHGSKGNVLGPLMKRYEEAANEIDRVLELEDRPSERTRFRLLRSLWRLHSPEYALGLRQVEELANELLASGRVAPADSYNFACFYGLACKAAAEDASLTAAERSVRLSSFRDQAMSWLRRAADAHFFEDSANAALAKKDTDLDAIRDHPDFSRLIEPPATPAGPPPAAVKAP